MTTTVTNKAIFLTNKATSSSSTVSFTYLSPFLWRLRPPCCRCAVRPWHDSELSNSSREANIANLLRRGRLEEEEDEEVEEERRQQVRSNPSTDNSRQHQRQTAATELTSANHQTDAVTEVSYSTIVATPATVNAI